MSKLLAVFCLAFSIAACSEPDIPTEPPAVTPPPDVATTGFLTAYTEQTIDMSVAELRGFMEETNLIDFFEPTENISNPVETRILEGNWPQPGATRWVKLADGHYVIERVTENRPNYFQYQLFIFTNATGRGVAQIVGEQRFRSVEGGTTFEWTYNVLPKNIITRQIVRGRMDEIQTYIAGGLGRFAAAANASVAR